MIEEIDAQMVFQLAKVVRNGADRQAGFFGCGAKRSLLRANLKKLKTFETEILAGRLPVRHWLKFRTE